MYLEALKMLAQRAIFENFYENSNPFEIEATPDHLKNAIQEKREQILNYTFSLEKRFSYSPLEYAIRIGDTESVSQLIDYGASTEHSPINGKTVLHFFMDCIEENKQPNLEILDLILSKTNDINLIDALLNLALVHMRLYRNIHWNVIDALLQKGAKTSNEHSFINWTLLKDVYHFKMRKGFRMSMEEELLFLNNLSSYLNLEKKYYPNSDSALSLEEFKLYSKNIKSYFIRTATSALKNPNPIYTAKEENFVNILDQYKRLFSNLVKNESFSRCFLPLELDLIFSKLKGDYFQVRDVLEHIARDKRSKL